MPAYFDPRRLPSPAARAREYASGGPLDDTSRPPGNDRGGWGAPSHFEVPPGRVPGEPGAEMGRAMGAPNALRDARGTFLHRGADDYLRGGGGIAPWREARPGRAPRIARSDGRIEEDVNELLTRDPRIDASDLWVECREGIVSLRGTVEARWKRYHIEDQVALLPGVRDVDNRIEVASGTVRLR